MSMDILMPALSPTMESGTLAKWLVTVGDRVQAGQVIAEIETDKASMEYESADDGVIGALLVAAGTEGVKVGTPIATLLAAGETGGETVTPSVAPVLPAPAPVTPAPPAPPVLPVSSPAAIPVQAPSPAVTLPDERVKASPLARRLAELKGLPLGTVTGSGPGGRIVRADVEGALGGIAPVATPVGDAPYEDVKLSGMRKVIARRMVESKTTVPHFYLTVDVTLDALLAARTRLNEVLAARGVKLSVNDFILKAAGLALKAVPDANVHFLGDSVRRFARADIAVAVAVPGGLVTPVLRSVCSKGLVDIAQEMTALASKARAGKLLPEEYQGGSFSLSNLGMYGVKQFDAVINPPQGAILAVGAGTERAVVKNGALAVATVMTCTLSVDHRALDGAIGAAWLAAFKGFIEEPVLMLA